MKVSEDFYIEFNDFTPKYLQIVSCIKTLILKRKLKDKEKLPSIRDLSLFLNVNNITAKNAYKKLMEEGYVDIIQGSGTFVSKIVLNGRIAKDFKETIKSVNYEDIQYIDFAKESIKRDYFPIERFKEIVMEVLNTSGADSLLYEETLGYMPLRRIIKDKFIGEDINIDNILIISGAQQGIDLAAKVLVNVNSNVVVEKPTYNGALNVFGFRRANIYDIEINENGINLNKLEEILKRKNIELLYLMTYFQNPTGISYSMENKEKLLYLADKYGFYIIEDDYMSELIWNKNMEYKTLKSMDKNDRVIYIKSFSKIFLPGIRLGFLISPTKLKDSFRNSKINTDIATSSLMQRALKLYMEKDYYKEHINKMDLLYKEKYELTLNEINKYLMNKVDFKEPQGGLSFFLKLKDHIQIDSNKLFYELKEKNVLITPASIYFKNSEEGLKNFKISISSLSNEEIIKGINIISSTIRE